MLSIAQQKTNNELKEVLFGSFMLILLVRTIINTIILNDDLKKEPRDSYSFRGWLILYSIKINQHSLNLPVMKTIKLKSELT